MAKSRYRKAYEGITGKQNDPYYSEARMSSPHAYPSSSARKSDRPGLLRGELTPEEVHQTAAVAEEGFTVRTTGPGVGRPARDVFSVGFAPDTGRAAEVAVTRNQPASEQIRRFNVENPALATRGANMGIGGWKDPETGIVGMDVSVLSPRTPEGLKSAMHIGVESNQAAIGNLGRKGYEGDINIPHHLQKDQYHGPLGYDPKVEDLGVQADTGRRRVRITPGLKEAVEVHAETTAQSMGLKETPAKSKGAGQYVKESLSNLRKTRRSAR